MSELMWIPVPAGPVRGDKPVLSVVMTPRLTEDLASAGMADWPSAVNAPGVTWRVQTRSAGSTTPDGAQLVATLRSQARPDVWQQLFGGIGVTPFSPPRGYHAPVVAETSVDATKVHATYQRAAVAVAGPRTVTRQLRRWEGEGVAESQTVVDTAQGRDPVPDFHRAVAMFREHPHVLRLLGLIVDVELDGLPESSGTREISVAWDASPVPVTQRWTRYEFDGDLFVPAADGDLGRGLVDLSDEDRWRIISFDVDGGVGRLRGAARSQARDRAQGAPEAAVRPTLPPLRSAGLMLTRVGRKDQLDERSARGLTASTGGGADRVLTAEDLVLGYRVDVRLNDSDTWFSLHRRNASYQIGDLPKIVVDDEEGQLKPHAAVLDDKGLRTDEVVARWDGWSLSVPRPRLDGGGAVRRRSSLAMPYRFEVGYDPVPASLLELEFGRAYQLRARVADLAGGGLLVRDRPEGGAAKVETYVRYEPLPPPRLVAPDGLLVPGDSPEDGFRIDPSVVGPGGSNERLVIRSEPDGEGFSTAPFDADPAYPDNRRRTFEAPLTTFALAEQHGVLRLSDGAGAELASMAFAGGQADEVSPVGVTAPQLTDPAALGMAVAVLTQAGLLDQEESDDRPWEGVWPQRIAKELELAAGPPGSRPRVGWRTQDDNASPDGEASPRVRVVLPPGCQAEVEVSSTVLADWIDRFALNRFLSETIEDEDDEEDDDELDANQAQNAMVRGRHPLLSPPRPLLLTHAVRRPLEAAHGAAVCARDAGETVARIGPTDAEPVWGVHVPSTGSVDVSASWLEWGDAAEPVPSTAAVAQVSIARGTERLAELTHDFGDTKHRMVTLGVTSVSRFVDCFVDTDPAAFRLDGATDPVSVKSSARPVAPVVVSVVPAFSWREERAAGTVTRHRLGGRLRVELARPWFTTGEGEGLAVLVQPTGPEALRDLAVLEDPSAGIVDPETLRDQVTWCNRDPIHATTTPPVLAGEDQFTGFQHVADVTLGEGGAAVRALVYPVFSHEGHWYADVELPGVAAASYSPFVRLVVARFQAESIHDDAVDLRMSSVVPAELSPVLPDRHLVVARGAGGIDVTLSGLGRLGGEMQANRVFASLERRADVAGEGDLTSLTLGAPAFPAWTRVAGGTVSGLLGGALPPLVPPADGGQYRLVVREVEELGSNVSVLGVDAPDELADRTVFVDVIDLSTL